MAKRILQPSEICPCNRGRTRRKTYADCCMLAAIEWFVDDDGSFFRHAPHTEGASKDMHGPGDPDPTLDPHQVYEFAMSYLDTSTEQAIAEMRKMNYSPDSIYALLQTAHWPLPWRTLLAPKESVLKWAEAIVEYRSPQRLPPIEDNTPRS